MALWLVRAGRSGEFELRFLEDSKIYLTWEGLHESLAALKERNDLFDLLRNKYPDVKLNTARNWTGQVWPFIKEMKLHDWVVLPSKKKPAIHIAEIVGEYTFHANNPSPFFHSRSVKWIGTDIPRTNFGQDLLYSFGAFMTICQIKRNDAEVRVRAMRDNQWKEPSIPAKPELAVPPEEAEAPRDLEELARDEISKLLTTKFKGHAMAVLVEAILKAQGYTTHRSPAGPDKGVDILAAPGSLGFEHPRICVQVKSGDQPVDRPTLDQLIGAMQNVGADQGLLVSLSGFKSSVDKEIATQFFRVRMWDQNDIIDQLTKVYQHLDEDVKAEIPLKQVWALAIGEED